MASGSIGKDVLSEPAALGDADGITWDIPDRRLRWTLEPLHWPGPVLPLEADLAHPLVGGINAALSAYGEPMAFRCAQVNTFIYLGVEPLAGDDGPPPGGSVRLETAIAGLRDRWDRVWLPEILDHLAFLEAIDPRALSDGALAAHLDATIERFERVWQVHFALWVPLVTAMSEFDRTYRELLGGEGPFDAYRLLQGFDNKTLEIQRILWQSARPFLGAGAVKEALDEARVEDVLAGLARSAEGRALRQALDRYLEDHGHAGVRGFVSTRSWNEDPAPVLRSLRDLARRPDRDPEAEMAALAREREAALREVRSRLAALPAEDRERFEGRLAAAQVAVVLSEDHSHWIDSKSIHQVRGVLLEVGRRAAEAGTLNDREDVIFLRLDEVRASAAAPAAEDRRPTVSARRAEMHRFARVAPPPELGARAAGPPPATPIGRAVGQYFGGPPQARSDREVWGAGGSPGRARGPARVLRSFAEAGRVIPGDVLVVPTTSAPWTPLFGIAAAVVTDAGGVLCHAAIVARDYRVPAVVGAGDATSVIPDGASVEVDGDSGVVRILD